MSTKPRKYVTVIGRALLPPLLRLLQMLEGQPPCRPGDMKTSGFENGYSCAITALSVLLLESALHRTSYVRGDKTFRIAENYFSGISKDPKLPGDVEEVFAIRDAIVHNHLWEG